MRRTLGNAITEFGGQLPAALNLCPSDISDIAGFVNRAEWEFVLAGGDSGFFGGWDKVVFSVPRSNPYITLPAIYARAINMAACRTSIPMRNEFYEFLEYGIGLQGGTPCHDWCGAFAGYERSPVPTMIDLCKTNQYLTVFITNPADIGKNIIFQGALDQNGNGIYSQVGTNSIIGTYLTFSQPFSQTAFIVSDFIGIQKDQTVGDVLLYQTDATTGAQVLLSRYGPDETNPAYRRYYINQLPCGCAPCPPVSPCLVTSPQPVSVQVTAMCKREYFPVSRLTDTLIYGNIPALIEECKAQRYSTMDTANALALQAQHHARAIKLMNLELVHYTGQTSLAVGIAPFGSARMSLPMSAVRFG